MLFTERPERLMTLAVPPGLALSVGDRVTLRLDARRLLHAAWLAYGLPLFAMLAAVFAARLVIAGPVNDGLAVLLVLAGLMLGGGWARRQLRRTPCLRHCVPQLYRDVPLPRQPAPGRDGA